MNLASIAAVLVVAGLFSILAALTGVILWSDGKSRALIQSGWLRALFGIVGAVLIGLGIWQETSHRPAGEQAIKSMKTEVDLLERRVAALEVAEKELRADVSFAESLSHGIASDLRIANVQSILSTMQTSAAPEYCARNIAAVKPVEWSASENALCALAINSFWPVEVVVPITYRRVELREQLQTLRVPVAMAETTALHAGLTAEGLGIVYPKDTPHTLICAIRDKFIAETGAELVALAEAADYVRVLREPARLNTIQVGVSFGEHFGVSFTQYKKFTAEHWRQVCREAGLQFAKTVQERFRVLKRPIVVHR